HARLGEGGQGRQSDRILQAQVEVQGPLLDVRVPDGGEPRRWRHVARLVRRRQADCSRGKADQGARQEGGALNAGPSPWGAIEVRGARENNLRDVTLDIPKRRLTVFTGVSGSGKSSLVFSTIAAESQRLINETYSAFVQGFMPTLAGPTATPSEALRTASFLTQRRWALT